MSIERVENRFGTGVPTFMGGEYISDIQQTNDYDVVFAGVPYEAGASFRRGQDAAAATLRRYSDWDRLDGTTYVDLSRGRQILAGSNDRVADFGDLRIDESSPDATHKEIASFVGNIAANCLPVLIGGDHSITYSTFRGARSRIGDAASVAILHFDAHLDLEDAYPGMPRIWHGNPFRQLIEEGHIKGSGLFTIGVRGIVPKQWVDYADENGVNVVTADEVHEDRSAALDTVRKGIVRHDAVYITLDVDALDPAICPGTGVPTVGGGGLTPRDITDFTRSVLTQPLIGFDLVEYNPRYDPTGQSAMVIGELLYDILAFRGNSR